MELRFLYTIFIQTARSIIHLNILLFPRLACAFLEYGINKQDTINICMNNSVNWYRAYIAPMICGCISARIITY